MKGTTKINFTDTKGFNMEMVIEHDDMVEETGFIDWLYEHYTAMIKVPETSAPTTAEKPSLVKEMKEATLTAMTAKSSMASGKQISYLQALGYNGPTNITKNEANILIKEWQAARN